MQPERRPIVIAFPDTAGYTETYGGGHGTVALEGMLQHAPGRESKTCLIFMHPSGTMNLLPLPNALARAGVHVITCASRYPHNDTALIMEKVLIDLGQVVGYARDRLGYERVVLAGWSGGGSLSLFYQSQAEQPTLTETPAGDPIDLSGLSPADAVMQLAAHVSRATTLTEFLDASIRDEADPDDRDPELDLYGAANPNQPPYSAGFVARYREAQIARNRRITARVREQLEVLRRRDDGEVERCFVTHGTMADPRWLDPQVDPNDRRPGCCYLGDPRAVNNGPAGLARFSTLRSWLSQWSYDDSNADAARHGPRVSVPAMVVENSADDACTPSQTQRIYASLGTADKELHRIEGATHYYLGQPDRLAEATRVCSDWLARKGFTD
jgi:alpha-beta hydrolase superfamily lysophospholipase